MKTILRMVWGGLKRSVPVPIGLLIVAGLVIAFVLKRSSHPPALPPPPTVSEGTKADIRQSERQSDKAAGADSAYGRAAQTTQDQLWDTTGLNP